MSRRLFSAAGLLIVLYPFIFIAGSAPADIALSVVAILFLLRSAIEGDWVWLRRGWFQCLAWLWIYMILRACFAEVPIEAFKRAVPFIRYALFAVALSHWLLADAAVRRHFLFALTLAVLVLAADGLGQRLFGSDLFRQPVLYDASGYLRLTGPFHRAILGAVLSWLALPVLLPALADATGRHRVAALLATLLVVAAIALSGGRMALILTLSGLALCLLALPRPRIWLFLALAAALVMLVFLSVLGTGLFERQVSSTYSTLANWQGSAYHLIFQSGWRLAGVNPLFGIGANHFRILCPRLYAGSPDLSLLCNIHPHNIYLEWLIEEGIVGLALFLGFLTCVFKRVLACWPERRTDPVFVATLVAFGMRVWPLASSTGFFSPWGAPPFWLILGLLLAVCARIA